MRNYANDSNFPTERKIGLNLGVNKEKGGLELMVNDAVDPEIFGFRAHTRPFAPSAKLGFGLTALADINPERGLVDYGKPMFFNAGLDLDQPIIERDTLSMILFADVASMLPFFQEDVPGYGVNSGLAVDAIWHNSRPKNWGVDAGIFGKLLILDYRLEFLYSDGTFEPAFYNTQYDSRSPSEVESLLEYLQNPSDPVYDKQRMGIYGELGYTLDKVFYITGGYNWNWPVNPANADEWENDKLWIEVGLFKDLLPLYGSIGFTREGLVAPLINDETITFFDENLVLSGELVYPISPILEIAIEVKTNVFVEAVQISPNVYDYNYDWSPSVSIFTRLNG